MAFGAVDPSPISRTRMSWFKKSKKPKSHQPSQQPASLGVPAHIAAGPLGFGATLDLGVYPEGEFCSIKVQQPVGLIRSRCAQRRWFPDHTSGRREWGSATSSAGPLNPDS